MQKAYAQALERLIAAGEAEAKAVEKLVANLAARGRLKLLPLIRAELAASAARKSKSSVGRLEVAREEEKAEAIKAAKEAGIEAEHIVVNPALIRGWRARKAGLQVDRSGKRALVDLYRRIVNV